MKLSLCHHGVQLRDEGNHHLLQPSKILVPFVVNGDLDDAFRKKEDYGSATDGSGLKLLGNQRTMRYVDLHPEPKKDVPTVRRRKRRRAKAAKPVRVPRTCRWGKRSEKPKKLAPTAAKPELWRRRYEQIDAT